MNIFEKANKDLKKESKQCLPELRIISENSTDFYKNLRSISKPTLILLLEMAVQKIDSMENDEEYDERDWKDCLCYEEYIFDNLVNEAIEKCQLFWEEKNEQFKEN